MKLKYVLLLFVTMLFAISINAQDTLKRYQYDEFIYGITAPQIKDISGLVAYYTISENEVKTFNERLFQTDLSYQYRKTIYLPAGTLFHNKNIAYNRLDSVAKSVTKLDLSKKKTIYNPPYYQNDLFTPIIEDTSILAFLGFESPIYFNESCYDDCTSLIAKVNLGDGYNGFIIRNKPRINESNDWLYVFHHSDFIQSIRIGSGETEEGYEMNRKSVFEKFDYDSSMDILIEQEYYSWTNDYIPIYDYTLYLFKDGEYVEENYLQNQVIRNRIMGIED